MREAKSPAHFSNGPAIFFAKKTDKKLNTNVVTPMIEKTIMAEGMVYSIYTNPMQRASMEVAMD